MLASKGWIAVFEPQYDDDGRKYKEAWADNLQYPIVDSVGIDDPEKGTG